MRNRQTSIGVVDLRHWLLLGCTGLTLGWGLLTTAPDSAVAQATCDLDQGGPGDGGASALGVNSLACGPIATVNGANSTGLGHDADIQTTNGGAVTNGTAAGALSNVFDNNGTAIGQDATAGSADANAANDANATAVGFLASAPGQGTALGSQSTIIGGGNSTAVGFDANVNGGQNTLVGAESDIGQAGQPALLNNTALGFGISLTTGSGNTALGSQSDAENGGATALGFRSDAIGTGAIAIGGDQDNDLTGAQATGAGAIAIGAESQAGFHDTAIGFGAQALSNNATVLGANTTVAAGAEGSVAIGTDSGGNGATANLTNQFVMGTANHTYAAPGITSDLSRSRQSGPLEIVTSDAAGNLATDGGQLFNQLDQQQTQIDRLGDDIDRVESGVAVALSSVGPDLTGAERFGLSLNGGFFEGGSAIGGGATAVVWRGNAARVALTGGIGVGLDDDDAVGGRVGGQFTW
jgi:trimeric autotransporter adhesin